MRNARSFLGVLVISFVLALPLVFSAQPSWSQTNNATPATPSPVASAPTPTAQTPLNLKIIATKGHAEITFGELTDQLMQNGIVCVGEDHDSLVHHRIQRQIIAALFARDERLGVGMEMFQKPFQRDIDWYIDGQISEDVFLRLTEYKQRWGWDYSLYRPIVDFARNNKIPLAGLNAPKELTARIMKVGEDGLTAEEKQEMGPVEFNVAAHRNYWFSQLGPIHGNHQLTQDEKERFYEAMAVWDDYMAQSAASFIKERHLARLVILAGAGHVDLGFGIPDRAAKYASTSVAKIHIVIGADETDDATFGADYVIHVLP